ncbi:glycosyltransferase family 39 protein [Streptomyces sp. NBC_01264]|uniref:glycosyltransferase family 39 protein n=1 Tax=Streptomyces sp. NBC_01264 TaxID=2903804 RepID=UPI002252ADC2|nr:glycosyltransferase family 39 protein [Streptomyces sp. NBC_01264]MCX4777492.1 glycosyltransferase family 39 protein [Streptomyces sp. NBC_01264]
MTRTDHAARPETERPPPLGPRRSALRARRALRERPAAALVWLLPALATLAAGLYRISTPVLWHDELATLTVVRRPRGALLDMLQNVDAVHGAYYLLLHYWIDLFGDSPAMLRLPTVLAMAAAAACAALAGRRMFGARAGLTAGLLFALIPAVTRYAQEARSYAFVVLLAAAAMLLLLRALERPGPVRWLCYGAAVAAAGYLHLVSLVFLCAHAVGVALHWWKERSQWRIPVGFVLAAGLGVACTYPLIKLGGGQAGRQIGWIPKPQPGDLIGIWPQVFASAPMAAVLFLAAALAWGGERRRSLVFGTVAAVLPVVTVWTISQRADVSYFMPKYLFFVLPAWAVLAGAGIALVRVRGVVVALLAVTAMVTPDHVAVHQPLSHGAYTYPEPVTWFTPLDYRAAAGIVAAGYRPGDAAAYGQQQFSPWWGVDTGVGYYLPPRVRLRDMLLGQSGEQLDDLWPTLSPDPAKTLDTVAPPRIWLVSKDDGGDPFTTLPPPYAKALQDRYVQKSYRQVSGISVALLVHR